LATKSRSLRSSATIARAATATPVIAFRRTDPRSDAQGSRRIGVQGAGCPQGWPPPLLVTASVTTGERTGIRRQLRGLPPLLVTASVTTGERTGIRRPLRGLPPPLVTANVTTGDRADSRPLTDPGRSPHWGPGITRPPSVFTPAVFAMD
jgi:hypothetical protein